MTPTPAPLVVQTFQQKVAHNAEIAIKSGSTWVVLAAGVAATIYAAMTPAQIAVLVDSFPWLAGWTAPLGALAVFVIAKLKPSDAVSSQTKALVEELARLRMNQYLRDHGAAELPTPLPTPLPVAPAVTVPTAPPPPAPPPFEVPGPAWAEPPAAPPALPIDPRLLMSLIAEYMRQQNAAPGPPLGRGVDFDPSRK